ncbi:MAG: metallophosphoesterase [Bacteroidota bacterium]
MTQIIHLTLLLFFSAFLVIAPYHLKAQIDENQLVGTWHFTPHYALPGNASNIPGPFTKPPRTKFKTVDTDAYPLIFHGEEPSERIRNFISADSLLNTAFSIEMWLLDHVNQPVGVLATLKDRLEKQEPNWLLGYYEQDVIFSLRTEDSPLGTILHTRSDKPWKRYWHHLLACYDGEEMRLYLNAELVASTKVAARLPNSLPNPELEVASYLKHEPHMRTGNLLRELRIYACALSQPQVIERYSYLQQQVESGKLYPNRFHFNAGPYLHYATPSSINLVWETDQAARGVVKYGKRLPLQQTVELNEVKKIQELSLDGLSPATPYFYEVTALHPSGEKIESGILTFQTAVNKDDSYSFALMGDTEARPHINDHIGKLIWDERPNFIVNLGDLTDGGFEEHKFQWNYEYFAGTRPLHSRIPVFPVAGNGEGDLYWYRNYHKLPGDESYYSFSYGNAEFFMLNSNEREKEFVPGGKQYEWLEKALQKSTATWKFVAHHHAPYSSDENDYGNSWQDSTVYGDLSMRPVVPLYEKYGVDMVFFGHLHTYQRSLPMVEELVREDEGVMYVQCGGGGGNLEDFAPARAWFSAKTYRGHHYATVTVHGNNLRFQVFDDQGRMKDLMTLEKE